MITDKKTHDLRKKELKRIMTDVAKGKLSQKDAEKLIKPKKVAQKRPKRQNNTHKRKTQLNKLGGK